MPGEAMRRTDSEAGMICQWLRAFIKMVIMRWIASLALFLVLTGVARAAGPDDQYLDVYNEVLQADSLQQGGQARAAAAKYVEAQTRLQRFKADYPGWNPDVVTFRLQYLAEKLQALGKVLPSANASTASAVAAVAASLPGTALEQQVAGLQEQVRALTATQGELENKLKEALSVQPAAVSPVELAKREEEIVALKKERDLLSVALDQAKAAGTAASEAAGSKLAADLAAAQFQASEANQKLEAANRELATLKAVAATQPAPADVAQIVQERDKFKEELAARTKDLADAQAHGDAQRKEALAQRDELQKKLEAANRELVTLKAAAATQPAPADVAQIVQERDKLKEELAARSKDLADAQAHGDQEVIAADAQRKEALAQQDELQKNLEAANRELATLKAAVATQPAPADVSQIVQERDKLKEELTARTKDLADAEAHGDQEVIAAHAQVKEALAQRDELQKNLDAASAATTVADNAEIEQLRARLDVLEAKAVPYTTEELAILNQTPSQPPAQLPAASAAPAKRSRSAHSAMDLPPGAGPLMADALRASMERDFAQAEEKYREILRQDENNVYVLAHLANAQFAEGHLEDCEKTVDRALALDPDDPASLYLLGVLRYRQEKLDEALVALSRSAQLNSTNAGTQNYLGCVLADKGMRPAAETALRKALQLEPDYPDAHYNLAFIYATEKPPSPELARWHYKRAVDLGHAKSPSLETLLAGEK
jgi:Tfp pilus assembly protein PilF/chromosome segregation ATPase